MATLSPSVIPTITITSPSEEAPSTKESALKTLGLAYPSDVFWDGDEDEANPRCWSLRYKWAHVTFIFILTFVVSLASSMLAPALPDIMDSLGSRDGALASFVLSAYTLGFTLGPLLVAPLSEIYGRSIVYQVSSILYAGFSVGCALSTNVGMLIAFRLFAGCVGVTPVALGGCSVGDIMPAKSMGKAIAFWGLSTLFSPILAPIAGGYINQAVGWRWIFWVMVIPMGVIILVSPFLLKETYAPILLEWKTKQLRKKTSNLNLRPGLRPKVSNGQFLRDSLIRPLKFLYSSPIGIMLGIYVAIIYGYQYLLFSTLPFVYQDQYGFTSGMSGLLYLGTGFGIILAVGIIGHIEDLLVTQEKKEKKVPRPERCLWPLIPGVFLIPIGLFLYGWTLELHGPAAVPLVGLGIFGFGMMAIFLPVQMYMVEAFGVHSASAIAANNALRNIAGAIIPLGGQGLYGALGSAWGNSLLAFIAIAFIPIPFVVMRYGPRLRARDRNLRIYDTTEMGRVT